MLKFLLGKKQTGKTERLISLAEQVVKADKKAIFLVPEQFSFECQRALLTKLGPVYANRIQIESFTSLCNAVLLRYGGIVGKTLDDGSRFVLLRRAVSEVADQLKCYSNYAKSNEFCNRLLLTVSEFKQAGISAEVLLKLSDMIEKTSVKNKLYDFSLIMKTYDSFLLKTFIEPFDLIEKTGNSPALKEFFSGASVFIDEFKGFTATQRFFLEKLFCFADDVFISFTANADVDELFRKSGAGLNTFSNIASEINALIKASEKHAVPWSSQYFCDRFNQNTDVAAVADFLYDVSGADLNNSAKNELTNVSVIKAADPYSEISACFETISRLVREEGFRYKDFAVISRSAEPYNSIVAEVSAEYNLPCFYDTKKSLVLHPLSSLVVSALKAIDGFDTEDVLSYLKTGIAGIDDDEISKIENYAYVWSIDGDKWCDTEIKNPEGLTENGSFDSEKAEEISKIREKAIEPLLKLKSELKGNVLEKCKAVFAFLERINTKENLKNRYGFLRENGLNDDAEFLKLGYDAFIKAVDKLIFASDSKELGNKEFAELIFAVLSFETVGEIPQSLDSCIYGTADRVKLFRPKVIFAVGINEGVFPASVSTDGLLKFSEREMINSKVKDDIKKDFAVSIPVGGTEDCVNEKYIFGNILAAPSDRLYLSYPVSSVGGETLSPSSELESIKKQFSVREMAVGFDNRIDIDCLQSAEPSFKKMAANFNSDSSEERVLKSIFKTREGYFERFSSIDRFIKHNDCKISENTADMLYTRDLNFSATKADDFAKCRFMFFCKHGLKIEDIKKVDYDPLKRGNTIHYILENFIKNHFSDIGTLSDELIADEIEKLYAEYLEKTDVSVKTIGEKYFYLINFLKETALNVALSMNREFSSSDYKPKFCELKIGNTKRFDDGPRLDPVTVDCGNDAKISLIGKIDRVDTTDDGEIRVVDYKSGNKKFTLDSLLDGLNMQMLIYLYTCIKNGKELLSAEKATGVLYLNTNDAKSGQRFLKMNGIVLEDYDTVIKMEHEGKGKIIPVSVTKDGGLNKNNKASFVNEEQFDIIFKYLELTLKKIGEKITAGNIDVAPLISKNCKPCDYCDYRSVCRVDLKLASAKLDNNDEDTDPDSESRSKKEATLKKMEDELNKAGEKLE